MKKQKLISKILISVLLCSNLFSQGVFAQNVDNQSYSNGAKVWTSKDYENFNKNSTHIKQVKITETGIKRINNARKNSGLKELSTTDSRYIVPSSKEMISKEQSFKSDSISSEGTDEGIKGIQNFLTSDLKTYTPNLKTNGKTNLNGISSSNIMVQASTIIDKDGLPTSVDNSTNIYNSDKTCGYFPSIMNQGSLGSCVACSTTYYQMTYQYAVANELKASDNPPVLSPKFTYNLNNKGANQGLFSSDAYLSLNKHGAPTDNEFQYSNHNYLEWPTNATIWRDALAAKADSYGTLDINDKDGKLGIDKPENASKPVISTTDKHLFYVKLYLNDNNILTMATDILGWKKASGSNDCFYAVDRVSNSDDASYHQMTIVGYDNDKQMTDDNGHTFKGAFKIANSWGTTWGTNGFGWLAYDALNLQSAVSNTNDTNRMFAFDINNDGTNNTFWVTAKKSYTPKLLAQFTVNTSDRSQLGGYLQFSSRTTTPSVAENAWTGRVPYFNQTYTDKITKKSITVHYSFDGKTTADDGTFVLDYTDLINDNNISDISSKKWFLSFLNYSPDGTAVVPVTLKDFKLTNARGNTLAQYYNIPITFQGTRQQFPLIMP